MSARASTSREHAAAASDYAKRATANRAEGKDVMDYCQLAQAHAAAAQALYLVERRERIAALDAASGGA